MSTSSKVNSGVDCKMMKVLKQDSDNKQYMYTNTTCNNDVCTQTLHVIMMYW